MQPDTTEGEPNKGGRPSSYREEFVTQAQKLAELGATDREIADFFEVTERTLNRWKIDHPEFCQSLKVGKDAADDRVEQSLYRRALGYTHDAVKILTNAGAVVREEYVEHYPPDTTAAIFWLKNRRRGEWRDKIDHELTGKDGEAIAVALTPTEAARRLAFTLARGVKAQAEQKPE